MPSSIKARPHLFSRFTALYIYRAATVLNFHYTSTIDAPVSIVWAFYERPDILQLITPPWQPVDVIRREGGLGVGAETEFTIHLGPLPLRWLARHTECTPNQLFIDEQIDGPLDHWIHRHEFVGENGKTRLTDSITYALPGGEFSEAAIGWFVNDRLRDMFRYRHEVTQRECQRLAKVQEG